MAPPFSIQQGHTMSWFQLDYAGHVKPHFTTEDLVDWCKQDIYARYKLTPNKITQSGSIWIDPGGPILTDSETLTFSAPGLKMHVKIEHLFSAKYIWQEKARYINDDIVKVYCRSHQYKYCVVVPTDYYESILQALADDRLLLSGQAWQQEYMARITQVVRIIKKEEK